MPHKTGPREIAQRVYVYGLWLLLADIVVQFFLAGLGVLDSATFFRAHISNGFLVQVVALVLVPVGWYGRVPGRTLWLTASIIGLVVLQSVFLGPYRSGATGFVRAFASLHVVNGLLVFWVALRLLEKSRELQAR